MNLIEISEQLKDVPDQLLMKEVEAPSGAYPAYLVVTELSRRKRMRDQAVKEAPRTSVVQDLTQPTREQMMAAAAAQRQSMPPPMAQPMSQPSLNAPGIMAAPQAAQALAAQDVMGAEPRRMASGGMVSFAEGGDIKYDDRGVARFNGQFGSYLFPEGSLLGRLQRSDYRFPEGSLLGMYQSSLAGDPEVQRRLEEERRRQVEKAENAAELERIKNRAATAQTPVPVSKAPEFIDARTKPAGTSGGVRSAGAGTGGGGGGGGKGGAGGGDAGSKAAPYTFDIPAYSSRFEDQTRAAREALLAQQPLTEEQESAARARGRSEYQAQVPFRMGFLEEDIAKRQKDIEGRRSSNINEALIQSGLGIMRSKSPYFMQAAGEGGTEGLNAYRQGLKDIREGERDILQSKVSLANAQSLYDQGKFAAGDRERESAIARQQRGFDKASSVFATFAKEKTMEIEEYRADVERRKTVEGARQKDMEIRMEQEKLPATIDALRGQAAYYRSGAAFRGAGGAGGRLSDADQLAAENAANRRIISAMPKGMTPGSPEYQALWNRIYQEELIRRSQGANYAPPPAGGGAEFVGFK